MAAAPKRDLMKRPEFATATWIDSDGKEQEFRLEIPDYESMDAKQFEKSMAQSAGEFRGNFVKAGLQLAAVILPGIDEATGCCETNTYDPRQREFASSRLNLCWRIWVH